MAFRFIFIFMGLFFSACSSDKQIEAWVEKNPDKIIKALMKHQQDQQAANQPKPEMVKEFSSELFKNAGSPSLGSGPVEIAYFFDFNCGHCAKQGETIKAVLETNKIKVIYKNFPVLGPQSEAAAKAALAAHLQNKYREYYAELWKVREKNPETLKTIAKKLSLDLKKWEADMEGPVVLAELQHVRQLAEKMRVGGTPFLAIAPDKVFPGRVDHLADIIQSLN